MNVDDHTVHTMPTTTHGRYLVSRPSESPVGLLVGFHGYGENASIHLDELRRLPGTAPWLLVAVQGLHRFYDRQGQVIASWMTSEDRAEAIADNISYVAEVVRAVRAETGELARLVYAGFSQGTAMACRAAAYAGHRSDGVIVLGGDVPPEVKAESRSLPPMLIGRGRSDSWYTEDKLDADIAYLSERSSPHESVVFDGGHEWTDEFREAARRFLDARAEGAP